MFDKLRDKCDTIFAESKVDVGYYLTIWLYTGIQICLLLGFGYIFNSIPFVIIGTIVTNTINYYTYTHHCHKLENCIILTQISFVVFGYLANTIETNLSLILCIMAFKNIYINCPLEKTVEGKSESWHRYKAVVLIMIYVTISLILIRFNLHNLANYFLWSIIMSSVLMIKNKLERV